MPETLLSGTDNQSNDCADEDSLEEYSGPDPGKFNEDGSFIGLYGQETIEANKTAVFSMIV